MAKIKNKMKTKTRKTIRLDWLMIILKYKVVSRHKPDLQKTNKKTNKIK